LRVKVNFLDSGSFKVQRGGVRFWKNNWLGTKTFRDGSPNLYRILSKKDHMMANILWIVALKLSLRWGLVNKKNQLLVLGLETSGVELGSVRLAG
jgi:hypothetical protein